MSEVTQYDPMTIAIWIGLVFVGIILWVDFVVTKSR